MKISFICMQCDCVSWLQRADGTFFNYIRLIISAKILKIFEYNPHSNEKKNTNFMKCFKMRNLLGLRTCIDQLTEFLQMVRRTSEFHLENASGEILLEILRC